MKASKPASKPARTVKPVKAWATVTRGKIDLREFFWESYQSATWVPTRHKFIEVLITPIGAARTKTAKRGKG